MALPALALGGEASPGSARDLDLYELRIYHFASAGKQEAYDDFLAKAAVPAMNRAGIQPVGVFCLRKDDNPDLKLEADSTDLYVLLRHKSCESVLTANRRMMADAEFRAAGKAVIESPKNDPAYTRYESSLLVAFEQMPHLEVPATKPTRIYQLRIYESHNPERALAKIAMFNEGGEIAIFRRVGMTPAFFGERIIGSLMPNLTYMLGFDDMDAQKAAWERFRKDPAWIALKDKPEYAETVSTITNLLLRPAKSSQM